MLITIRIITLIRIHILEFILIVIITLKQINTNINANKNTIISTNKQNMNKITNINNNPPATCGTRLCDGRVQVINPQVIKSSSPQVLSPQVLQVLCPQVLKSSNTLMTTGHDPAAQGASTL